MLEISSTCFWMISYRVVFFFKHALYLEIKQNQLNDGMHMDMKQRN